MKEWRCAEGHTRPAPVEGERLYPCGCPAPCQHHQIDVDCEFNRIWSEVEGQGDLRFTVHMRVRCAVCRVRFAWIGPDMGLSMTGPMVDPSRLELRAPIVPDAHATSMMADDPEFNTWPPRR